MIPDLDIPDVDFTVQYLPPVSEALAAGAPVWAGDDKVNTLGLEDDMREALEWPRFVLDDEGKALLGEAECLNPGSLIEDFCNEDERCLIEELCLGLSLSFAVQPALLHAKKGDFVLVGDNEQTIPGLHVQTWKYWKNAVTLDSEAVVFVHPTTVEITVVNVRQRACSSRTIHERAKMLVLALDMTATATDYGLTIDDGRLRRVLH